MIPVKSNTHCTASITFDRDARCAPMSWDSVALLCCADVLGSSAARMLSLVSCYFSQLAEEYTDVRRYGQGLGFGGRSPLLFC
jgi:hypothetical protein